LTDDLDTHSRKASWLRCLIRLWTLRRADGLELAASERVMVLLAAASLVLWLILSYWLAGPDPDFDEFAIPTSALIILTILISVFAVWRASRPTQSFRAMLFIAAAALPVLVAFSAAMSIVEQFGWERPALLVLLIYLLVFAARALRHLTGSHQPAAVLAIALILGGYLWLDQAVYLSASIWRPHVADDDVKTVPRDLEESLLFDQQSRIDRAVDQVEPSISAQAPNVFFIGFAGVGSQRVFAEEIKLAERVVDSRFTVGTRQVLLMNDRRDLNAYPLATVSGLHYALQAIARKMNLERDILFLSLSSHGSDQPTLSVSNGILPLQQLTGKVLADALKDSGIKWRVIVISACHAGAFINALKDDNSILITAAAADRTSFGCADDRDLTYFGEAFYRDSLPTAATLEDAFSHAKAQVSARETAEHITASNPQAFFGTAIERQLKQFSMREP
jgi:hypothetical protein